MNKSRNNKYIALWIIIGAIVLFLGIMASQLNSNLIAKNTYIGSICVGGQSKEEAKSLLKDKVKMKNIILSYDDKTWDVTPQDIDAFYNFDKTIEKAYNLNRSKNIFEDILKTIKTNFGKRIT